MEIGILGTAEIAFRRFLPALEKCSCLEYAGVASRTPEKLGIFAKAFGGKAYLAYDALLEDESIDAVYIPLPPALHFEWGKKVLLSGKHLFMEKPFTTSLEETRELLELAERQGVAVHENYMFLYHRQLEEIKRLIADETLGEVRLYRLAFGFPKRAVSDFRYNKALGGGALLDCGGYPVRLALELLGETAKITQARLIQPEGYEVDLYGNAVLENAEGITAQISFGMDNSYKCELEVWGSKGCLRANRIFTAPPDFEATIILQNAEGIKHIAGLVDDSFQNSIIAFERQMHEHLQREQTRSKILQQARLVDEIQKREGT